MELGPLDGVPSVTYLLAVIVSLLTVPDRTVKAVIPYSLAGSSADRALAT